MPFFAESGVAGLTVVLSGVRVTVESPDFVDWLEVSLQATNNARIAIGAMNLIFMLLFLFYCSTMLPTK